MKHAILLIACFAVCSPGCSSNQPDSETAGQSFGSTSSVQFTVVESGQLTVSNVATIDAGDRKQLTNRLVVKVDRDNSPPMLGQIEWVDNQLVFTPDFPFEPGQPYVARLASASGTDADRVFRFTIPRQQSTPTQVVEIYPTSDRLPENQLKFYIHFSAPMSVGQVYRNVHLTDESGARVESPFLELGEELWDRSGTRFTLFIDPGRIKRGLKPREELGPALVEGGKYDLTVDANWTDSNGQPLSSSYSKSFEVTAPDAIQPDADKWTTSAPTAGTTDALMVTFDEPLDHAMLQRVLTITDNSHQPVSGEIVTTQHETKWHFTPHEPWLPGEYSLTVETILEDLAGNSLAKPFEVSLQSDDRPQVARTIGKPFRVRPARQIESK